MNELLIKNGMVYSYIYEGYHAIKMQKADVYIKDGQIESVNPDIKIDCEQLDASGCLVLPGMINMGSNTFAARITSGLLCDRRPGKGQIAPLLDLAIEMLSLEEICAVAILGFWETIASGVTTIAEVCAPRQKALAPGMKRAAETLGVRFAEAPYDSDILVDSAVSCAHFGVPYAGFERVSAGAQLTMGTGFFDSCMISEMRATACFMKQHMQGAGAYKASDVFYSATVVNGRILDASKYGRVGQGFFGDLSVVCMDRFAPLSYPLAQYVYGANAGDVRHVVSGGQVLKRDHKPDKRLMAPLLQAGEAGQAAIQKFWAEARRRIL